MSQLELMFKDALGKYNQQTKKDLENEPFVADLKNCKTAGDVMKILREPANKLIDRQEKDKEKSGLMRLLDRIVDVLHALHLNETLGEGIGTVWGPGKAVIGAVVVLLETARNVREGYKMLMELLEDVSSFIVRLEVYSKNTISSEMREILVKLLGKVMSIVGLATEQIREGRWKRYMKTLLGDSAVEDAFKKLNRLTSVETQMASTESLKLLHDLVSRLDLHMQGVQPPLTEIQKNLDSLNVSIADIKKDVSEMNRNDMVRDCREWLSSPDPSTNHNAALNSHHEGTAVWFIEGEMMQEWKIVGSLLWVCGKPGSGKTILCSAIIEALLCNCLMLNHVVVYFYCDFRDPAKQDIDGLLSRLLVDMSAESTECTKILWDFYSTHRNGSRRASNTELTQCFEKMLRASSHRSVYIVIDALDECPDSGNKPPRDRILTLIHDLLGLGLSNVHICVTSRPEAGIAEVLVHLQSQTIAIDGDVGQTDDIDSYVRSSVYGDIKFRSWSEELKALVFKVLSEKADGMFRWVSCQLETLRLCPPSRVKRTLETLPKTLDETYDRILDRIRGTEAEHDLLRIFQCLAVCVRPLEIQELAEVLAMDLDGDIPELKVEWRYEDPEATVLGLCSTLVMVHPGTKQVQFAHFSVQEYLLSSRLASKSLNQFHIVEREAHAVIAKACLGVLFQLSACTTEGDATAGEIPRSPLASYAAKYWVEHASIEGVSYIIRKAMESFFDPSDRFIRPWIQLRDMESEPWLTVEHEIGHGLYYASLFGFEHIVEHILDKLTSSDCNTPGGRYGTALGAACFKGYLVIARLLIKHGADVNAPAGKYGTALTIASSKGHAEIARLLIEHGADINALDGEGDTALLGASCGGHIEIARLLIVHGADVNAPTGEYGTALGAMSGKRREDVEIVRLLIEHGADVNAPAGEHGTALAMASLEGHVEISRLLVEHGADVNAPAGEYGTALTIASLEGHVEIARLLIEHGADVNAPAGEYGTALRAASGKRWEEVEIVRLLIELGANVNALAGEHGTALAIASSKGHVDIVRLLIEHGADVNAPAGKYGTALTIASSKGHAEIARLLIELGADVNALAGEYGTALGAVSGNRWEDVDIVHLLIELGANVNALAGEHGTALAIASSKGHAKIACLLIEHGADVDALAGKHGTALAIASLEGHVEIAHLLIEHGADVNAPAGEYGTALAMASLEGHAEIARLLIEHGADVDAPAGKHGTALAIASLKGHVEIARLLVELGADVNAPAGEHGTALAIASLEGHIKIAQLLIEHGADINAPAGEHELTALTIALLEGDIEIARLLIEHGAGVSAPAGECYGNVLALALSEGHVEIACLLIDLGADLDALTDTDGSTALAIASRGGHVELARLLIEHGAYVNAPGGEHFGTALQEASKGGHSEIIRLLIENGADVNAAAEEHGTALEAALREGEIEIARLLIEYGANVDSLPSNLLSLVFE